MQVSPIIAGPVIIMNFINVHIVKTFEGKNFCGLLTVLIMYDKLLQLAHVHLYIFVFNYEG